jgi:hypothetical protein
MRAKIDDDLSELIKQEFEFESNNNNCQLFYNEDYDNLSKNIHYLQSYRQSLVTTFDKEKRVFGSFLNFEKTLEKFIFNRGQLKYEYDLLEIETQSMIL